MATNPYFNFYPSTITQEQLLVESIIIEALQIHGLNAYYLPRTIKSGNEIDYIYGEDTLKEYTAAYPIEMYLENVMGMEGEGDFLSKFGLEIRDEVSLLVSRKRFKHATSSANLVRPREGDLIYLPLIENFLEITFVEHENNQAMYYTLGRGRGGNVYVYALKLKQFVFSSELISTGISDIDTQIEAHYPRIRLTIDNTIGTYNKSEIVYQGTDLANATAHAIVYSTTNNTSNTYLDLIKVTGDFRSANVIGNTSGAVGRANVVSTLPSMDYTFEDLVDNTIIQTEGAEIIDFSSINPFGVP